MRRQSLADSGDRVETSRRQVPEDRESFSQARELIEHRAQIRRDLCADAIVAEEPRSLVEVPLTKRLDTAKRANQLALLRLLGDGEQCVRRSSQRRNHDEWPARQTTADDLRRAFDGCRVADGRATELDDDHAEPTTPAATRSSAFNTEPPAAPRMVLWPNATRRRSSWGSVRTRPTTTVIPAPAPTSR